MRKDRIMLDDMVEQYENHTIKAAKPKRSKKKKRGVFYKLVVCFAIAITAICMWFIYCYAILIFQKDDRPLEHADAGIILGAALWNNTPSPALKERLDEAITLYEQGIVNYLILSGGKPASSKGLTEAEGMRNYLTAAGISEEHLLLESHSTDTYENIIFSAKIMEQEQLDSVIIISHNYHGLRAADIASYIDLNNVQIAGVKSKVLNEAYHYTREVLAYSKWQLNKLLAPVGIYI